MHAASVYKQGIDTMRAYIRSANHTEQNEDTTSSPVKKHQTRKKMHSKIQILTCAK